jgi:hypothetical protein
MIHDQGGEFRIDVRRTPMSNVAAKSAIVVATAEAITPSELQIRIYRRDPKDEKPYNVDTYAVWEDLTSRPDFLNIVKSSSTDYDNNMRAFLEDNVLIVPRLPGENHWLDESELPLDVRYEIKSINHDGVC